jgi:hypothetical protein
MDLRIDRAGNEGEDLVVRLHGKELTGSEAEKQLWQVLLARPLGSIRSVYEQLSRTHYLGQERVLTFLREDRPTERFQLVSDLLGLEGLRVTYKRQVDSLKMEERLLAHTRLDCDSSEAEVRRIEQEIAEAVSKAEMAADPERRRILLETAGQLVRETSSLVGSLPPTPSISDIRLLHGRALADLSAREQALSRLRAELREVEGESSQIESMVAAYSELEGQLKSHSDMVAKHESALSEIAPQIDRALSDERERQVLARQASDEQALWAQLARLLRRVKAEAGVCPLCGQSASMQGIANRLDEMTRTWGTEATRLRDRHAEATASSATLREVWTQTQRALDSSRDSASKASASLQKVREVLARLEKLGVEVSPSTGVGVQVQKRLNCVTEECSKIVEQKRKWDECYGLAEAAIWTERLSTLRDRLAIERSKFMKLQASLTEKANEVAAYRALSREFPSVQKAVVRELLARYENGLQELYKRVQPHPLFPSMELDFGSLERGELYFLAKPSKGRPKRANMIFSGGQLSAFAVVLFLLLNMSQDWTRLQTVLLDDPIQNMDDIGVLGIVDLVRQLVGQRQIVFSTHSDRFSQMLKHKFRVTEAGRETILYRFEGITDTGPVISRYPEGVVGSVE